MAICVANVDNIPADQINALHSHVDLFRATMCVDDLLKSAALLRIVQELDALCASQWVVGFHFTRAIRESILKDGLVIKPGADRRDQFIAEFGHRFTEEQLQRIKRAWQDYFPGQQDRSRNGRVCLALTREALANGGADPLLRYFGGEAIYMPLLEFTDVAKILGSLGEPLIVQCALDPTRSKAYYEFPWGTVWLSSYHCSVNPNARQLDQDVSALYSIPAADIISVSRPGAGV